MAAKRPARASLRYTKTTLSSRYRRELHHTAHAPANGAGRSVQTRLRYDQHILLRHCEKLRNFVLFHPSVISCVLGMTFSNKWVHSIYEGEQTALTAYRGQVFATAVRARGGVPRVVETGVWAKADAASQAAAEQQLKDWNRKIHAVRCRIEKIFGTWKRSYGFHRMRWRGLAKARLQTHLTAIAYNLKRTFNILQFA